MEKKKGDDRPAESSNKDDLKRLGQNAELKEVMMEKDNTIKELKSTIEVNN